MSKRTQRASRWGANTSRIGRKKWTRLNLQNTMSSTDSTVIGAMNCFSKKNVFHIHTTCVPNSIHRMALVCLQLSRLLLPPRSVFQSGVLYIARPSFEPSRQEASRGPKMRGNSHVLPSWLLWLRAVRHLGTFPQALCRARAPHAPVACHGYVLGAQGVPLHAPAGASGHAGLASQGVHWGGRKGVG